MIDEGDATAYWAVCFGCYKIGPERLSSLEASLAVQDLGWFVVRLEHNELHLCPDCFSKMFDRIIEG